MAETVEVYQDEAQEYRWRKRAGNGEIVADSGEGYETKDGALLAARRENPEDAIEVLATDSGEAADGSE